MNTKGKTLLAYLDILPPIICRMLARERQRPLTAREIAERSGLAIKTVRHVSKLKSWANVQVRIADAFRTACGVTPLTHHKQLFYLRRVTTKAKKPLGHLDKLHVRAKWMLNKALKEMEVTQ